MPLREKMLYPPMAYGAWVHNVWFIVLGLGILVIAWCNGIIWKRA